MKKLLVASALGLALAGCANATRTVPVLVVEDRPIPSVIDYPPPITDHSTIIVEDLPPERPRLVVPKDQTYLPQPYHDKVLDDYKKNNFLGNTPAPMPTPRPYTVGKQMPKCKPGQSINCVK
jgi:hypothetical protein